MDHLLGSLRELLGPGGWHLTAAAGGTSGRSWVARDEHRRFFVKVDADAERLRRLGELGDPDAENLMRQGDAALYLIDWDEARVSDPARDIGQVLWWYVRPERWGKALAECGLRRPAAAASDPLVGGQVIRRAQRPGEPTG
jgi:aminoglycoside phosphotransferase (APT) family kinase protein